MIEDHMVGSHPLVRQNGAAQEIRLIGPSARRGKSGAADRTNMLLFFSLKHAHFFFVNKKAAERGGVFEQFTLKKKKKAPSSH